VPIHGQHLLHLILNKCKTSFRNSLPLDGDIVFAVSTNKMPLPDPVWGLAELGAHAANVTARAIARAVYEASGFSGEPKGLPAYKDRFKGTAK
jgi:L-aminopeptidase/D-esterase